MNSIEQHVIVKGGTTCLFGTAEKGYQWSNLGGDFLLSRILCSKRIRRVLCLNLDRNPSSIVSIANLVSSFSDNEEIDTHGKLKICGANDFLDSRKALDVNTALSSIKTTVYEWMEQELPYSIVVYSLSEMILSVGLRKAVSFVKELVHVVQSERSISSIAPSSTPSVVFVVHESLHSPSVITQLQSLVSVVVKVVPNSGTLSPEVVAEMQTIRKSATTGKVMECIEMFGYREGLLYAMKTGGAPNDNDMTEEAVDEDVKASGSSNSSSAIMNKLLAPATTAPEPVAATTSAAVDTSKRLITFDSTDPEFDEDSDPDADLDL